MSVSMRLKTFLLSLTADAVFILLIAMIWVFASSGEGRYGAVIIAYLLTGLQYGIPLLCTVLFPESLWENQVMIGVVIVIRLLLAGLLTVSVHRLTERIDFRKAFVLVYAASVFLSLMSLLIFLPHGTIGPP